MLRYTGILTVAILGWAGSSVAAADQYEPNDVQSQATPVIAGIPFSGAIETANDEDWFALYPAAAAQVTITFSNTEPASSGTGCDYSSLRMAQLVDAAGRVVESASARRSETEQIAYTLAAGQPYYLVVSTGGFSCAGPFRTYTFQVAGNLTTQPCFAAMQTVDQLEKAVARTLKALRRARRPTSKKRLRRTLAKQKRQLAAAQGSEASTCA